MDSNLLNCFVCLNANNLHKFGVFGNRKYINSINEDDDDDESSCVDNQVQVIFMLKKMLQIPNDLCIKFFQEYGNPCSWIYCCNLCSVLVDKARSAFDEIALLQQKFEKLQMDLKKAIIQSVRSPKNKFYDDLQNEGPNVILRSYIANEFTGCISEPQIKVEDIEDVDITSEMDSELWSPIGKSDTEVNYNICVPSPQSPSNNDDEESNQGENNSLKEEDDGIDIIELSDSDDIGIFSCDICKIDFRDRSHLMTHNLQHSKIKSIHECDICKKRFTDAKYLTKHYQKHTIIQQWAKFVCKICNKSFKNRKNFTKHLGIHKEIRKGTPQYKQIDLYSPVQVKVRIKCKVCGEKFEQYNLFAEHSKTIHGVEVPLHVCDICKSGFPDTIEFNNHMRLHSVENLKTCVICKKSFTSNRNLYIHLRSHSHTEGDPYKCYLCDQKFKQKYLLTFHLKKEHESQIPMLSCPTCGKKFLNQTKLNRHMEVHMEHRPFSCDKCDDKFKNKFRLKAHQQLHKQPSLQCDFCEKSFYSSIKMKIHINKTHRATILNPIDDPVTKKEPPKRFKCKAPACKNRYTLEEDLAKHIQTHVAVDEESVNRCEYCAKVFRYKGPLIIHRRDHTGERPYQCEYCSKTFTETNSLMIHRNTHRIATIPEQPL